MKKYSNTIIILSSSWSQGYLQIWCVSYLSFNHKFYKKSPKGPIYYKTKIHIIYKFKSSSHYISQFKFITKSNSSYIQNHINYFFESFLRNPKLLSSNSSSQFPFIPSTKPTKSKRNVSRLLP